MSDRRANQNRSFFTWIKSANSTDTGLIEKGSAADPGVCALICWCGLKVSGTDHTQLYGWSRPGERG
jgi:hypothetical protein